MRQGETFTVRARRVCRFAMGVVAVAVLMVLATAAPGLICRSLMRYASRGVGHGQYVATLENRSNQAVVINVLGQDHVLRPCSLYRDTVNAGPPLNEPLQVKVRDMAGQTLADWSVTPCRSTPKLFCEVHIHYPVEDAGQCPPDIRNEFIVSIQNNLKRDLDLTLDGLHLGKLPSLGSGRFGPIPGDWEKKRVLIIRDDSGRELAGGEDYLVIDKPVYYDLGTTPVLEWTILVGPGSP